jgi:RNA recognition motif-containing protein
MAMRLYVGGLSNDTTDASLNQFFAECGSVVSAKVITDRETGQPRGFGFVEMSNDDESRKAMAELNGKSLDGKNVAINEARPREESGGGNRGGGFGGGNGGGYGGGNRGGSRY